MFLKETNLETEFQCLEILFAIVYYLKISINKPI